MKETSDKVILGISCIALLGLVWLIYFHSAPEQTEQVKWVSYLPAVNAGLNSLSAFCLIMGLWAIKNQKKDMHKKLMVSAFIFSACFLISYIIYHYFHGDTKFQGQGLIRVVYFFILISHIILSAINLPMILRTFYLAMKKDWVKHKKMARWTFPCWLYVSVTGVMIFFFLKLN